jgi:L-seryl-tRNA(Ser) seleniumtransferase
MLDLDDHFELWNPPVDFIDKARLQGFPRQGIGRALKVSKEQIAALLTALQLFVDGHYASQLELMHECLDRIASSLESLPGYARVVVASDGESMPILQIMIDETKLRRSAFDICRGLRAGTPPIYVGHGLLAQGWLVINPLHLNAENVEVLIRRLGEELGVAI